MKITVYTKNVYGNNLIYPIGKTACDFTRLTGTKTFSKYHLGIIKALGYEIQQILGSEIIDDVNRKLRSA